MIKFSVMKEVIWIGLAHVIPNSENVLDGSIGAYVNIVGYARSPEQFEERIKVAVLGLDMDLLEVKDVELFEMRTTHEEPAPAIFKLVEELKFDRSIKFDTFHSYRGY
jgi:hypothetical protein